MFLGGQVGHKTEVYHLRFNQLLVYEKCKAYSDWWVVGNWHWPALVYYCWRCEIKESVHLRKVLISQLLSPLLICFHFRHDCFWINFPPSWVGASTSLSFQVFDYSKRNVNRLIERFISIFHNVPLFETSSVQNFQASTEVNKERNVRTYFCLKVLTLTEFRGRFSRVRGGGRKNKNSMALATKKILYSVRPWTERPFLRLFAPYVLAAFKIGRTYNVCQSEKIFFLVSFNQISAN